MDLELTIDRSARGPGHPVYRQIFDQIREAVLAGQLVAGDRLPPIRTLAQELGVNRDTVLVAYESLARDGLLDATVGRGTFVRGLPAGQIRQSAPEPVLSPLVERLLEFERARPRYAAPDDAVPLHSLVPDPSVYPVKAFRRSLNRVLNAGGSELLVYGGHQGDAPLRDVIARHLAGHGIQVDGDNVVICQGASQGISLALRLYTQPGDWVAIEEPTYHNVLGVLVALGLRPAPVPMLADGPDPTVLARTLARPEVKLFYTMPSFHNPMGITTSRSHRLGVLEAARHTGKPIIEDAFEMDLRYDGDPVPPLASLDGAGLVVHLFSFSKSLFPGVRVGAITTRGRALDGLLALKYATDLSGTRILQAAIADFVETGGYERHLRQLRTTLLERRDVIVSALAEHMPADARWTRPDGGYQVWLELPEPLDTRSLLPEAQALGVSFSPGYQFHHDGRPSGALRLTTALADTEQIRRGIEILGSLVRRHLSAGPRARRDTGVQV